MVYPLHIPWTQRKALCGRLIFFDVAHPYKSALLKNNAGVYNDLQSDFFREIRDQVRDEADGAISGDAKPLDAFLRDIVDDFRPRADKILKRYPALSQNLLTKIDDNIRSLSCEHCSPLKGRICDGKDERIDDEIVARQGHCISSLKKIFEIASQTALAYYSTYGTVYPSSPPEIVLSTWPADKLSDVHQVPVNLYVGGHTNFRAQGARSLINLSIVIDDFDVETYRAVLYVMFHECIAHALHGIFPDYKGRQDTEPYESFSEGWMDKVALLVMEQLIVGGTGPAAHLLKRSKTGDSLPKIPFEEKSFKIAEQFHEARKMPEEIVRLFTPDRNPRPGHYELEQGVLAADAVFNHIKEEYKSGRFQPDFDHWAAFFRLSFDLNMMRNFDAVRRDAFVALMYQLSWPESVSPNYSIIKNSINEYLDRQDAAWLIHRVCQVQGI